MDRRELRIARMVAGVLFEEGERRAGVSEASIAHSGVVDRVEVLAVDRLRFRFAIGAGPIYKPGDPLVSVLVEVERRDGRWFGVATSDRPAIAHETLTG